MPIKIMELNISVSVNQTAPGQTGTSNSSASGGEQESIVEESVEQILKIIQDKKER